MSGIEKRGIRSNQNENYANSIIKQTKEKWKAKQKKKKEKEREKEKRKPQMVGGRGEWTA